MRRNRTQGQGGESEGAMPKSHSFRNALIRISALFVRGDSEGAIRVIASPERTTDQRRAAAVALAGFVGVLSVLVISALKIAMVLELPSWADRFGFAFGALSFAIAFAGVMLFWIASPTPPDD